MGSGLSLGDFVEAPSQEGGGPSVWILVSTGGQKRHLQLSPSCQLILQEVH